MVEFKISREFFLLSLLVILGSSVFYNFVLQNFIYAFFGILFGVVFCITYSILVQKFQIERPHSEIFIESIANLTLFLFPMIAYGFLIFQNSIQGIILLVIFAIMQLVNFVKNWTNSIHYTKGFPIVLHGIFFPFTYFVTILYAPSFEQAIFATYFIITSILSTANVNFIGFQQSVFEDEFEDVLDDTVLGAQEKKDRDLKEQERIRHNIEDNKVLKSIETLSKNTFKDESVEVKIRSKNQDEEFEENMDLEDENFLKSISRT